MKRPNYIPELLPCGVRVNEHWKPGRKLECCRTVCPTKSNTAIEACYAGWKTDSKS